MLKWFCNSTSRALTFSPAYFFLSFISILSNNRLPTLNQFVFAAVCAMLTLWMSNFASKRVRTPLYLSSALIACINNKSARSRPIHGASNNGTALAPSASRYRVSLTWLKAATPWPISQPQSHLCPDGDKEYIHLTGITSATKVLPLSRG